MGRSSPALLVALVCVAFVACDTAGSAPPADPTRCDVTLTRRRCVASCEAAGTRTFSDQRAADEGCGGNHEEGCFYETATGNLWSSPSTTVGTVRFDGFRSCTSAEKQQMLGGASFDAGVDADAEPASTLCTLTITRVHCASECAEVRRTRTFVERRIVDGCGGNAQEGCLYELATGDLWTSPTTTYMQSMFEELRECTAEEQALAFGGPPADAGDE